MGGKSLVLLGLLAGGLYTYFCINTHKDQLYAKLYPSSTTPVAEEKVVSNNILPEAEVASIGSMDLGSEKVVTALGEATDKDTQEELQSNEEVLKQLEASTQKKVAVAKDSASFYFVNEKPYIFNANLAENRSESEMVKKINQFCQTRDCSNDIKFLDSVKDESWSKDALNIVNYLADNNVKNGSLSIKDGVLKITGELEGEKSKEGIQNLLNAFGDDLNIQNETTIAKVEEIVTPEPVVEEIVEEKEIVIEPIKAKEVEEEPVQVAIEEEKEVTTPPQTVVTEEVSPILDKKIEEEKSIIEESVAKVEEEISTPPKAVIVEEETPTPSKIVQPKEKKISVDDKIRQAQSEINILLQDTVINFKVNSSEILPASREILDRIIAIVNRLDISVNADVLGHTDASGSKRYNKKLSQRRANSVKKYLIDNGMNISKLTAIGYGEENLIFAPYDKRNRRVEIYLTKGE